jgi:predicted DNA-binding transcriptional regulator YafY
MEATMRRADRLFQLIQLLRARRVLTAARLARALAVSERTVYRDVQDLIASGVPIKGEAGIGYALPRSFELPPLMFSGEEIEALVLGARVVESWSDPALARAAASVLTKVELVLPERLKQRIAKTPLLAPGFHRRERATAHLTALRAAISDREKVDLVYAGADATRTERTVHPLGLFFWGSTWSATAWCELRQDFRNFRLDRIEQLRPTGERFETEAGRTLDDFLARLEAQRVAGVFSPRDV